MTITELSRTLVAAGLLAATIICGTARAATAVADSLLQGVEEMVVSGQAAPPPEEGSTRVPAPVVQLRDAGNLAELGVILPSVRVAVNSRGESSFMVRGAPERHSQAFLDGIPLNLPWDERVDLQSIPITGVGRLEGRRGLPSLLDGPGVLSGSVRILPPEMVGHEPWSRLSLTGGEHGLWRGTVTHQRKTGAWSLLGAAAAESRDGWPLPAGGDRRANSDARQASLLLRGSRAVADGGRLNLLLSGWDGEKGVPAELHLGRDARFWRYPLRQRLLMGGSVHLPLGEWELAAMTAADFFNQEIDPRGPDRWGAPREPGDDYEKSWDRTAHAMAGATRWLGPDTRLTLQGNLRYTHHREILAEGDPTLAYAQWLTGLVLEGEHRWTSGWDLRAGLGWDHAATPEAGNKPRTPGFDAEALNLRLSKELGRRGRAFAAVSRRSRFPGLRELYSGALGRFVANYDLLPEKQNLLEVGLEAHDPRWRVAAAGFWQRLDDGIERITLPGPDRQFMRVNRTRIRVPGLELSGAWRLRHDLELSAQHTILDARVEEDGRYDRWAEDRPQYLGRIGLDFHRFTGPGMLLEAAWTGPRWSADATDELDGLRRLPAGIVWNVRLSWMWDLAGREAGVHLRLDNVLDQRVDYQVGLPDRGRLLSGGFRLDF